MKEYLDYLDDFDEFNYQLTALLNSVDVNQSLDHITAALCDKQIIFNDLHAKIIGIEEDNNYLLVYTKFVDKNKINKSTVGYFYFTCVDNKILATNEMFDKNLKMFTNITSC